MVVSQVLSNTDAVLVAIPMLGILFVGYFRLDELFGKPPKKKAKTLVGRPMVELDFEGKPANLDPYEISKGEIPIEAVKRRRRVMQ